MQVKIRLMLLTGFLIWISEPAVGQSKSNAQSDTASGYIRELTELEQHKVVLLDSITNQFVAVFPDMYLDYPLLSNELHGYSSTSGVVVNFRYGQELGDDLSTDLDELGLSIGVSTDAVQISRQQQFVKSGGQDESSSKFLAPERIKVSGYNGIIRRYNQLESNNQPEFTDVVVILTDAVVTFNFTATGLAEPLDFIERVDLKRLEAIISRGLR